MHSKQRQSGPESKELEPGTSPRVVGRMGLLSFSLKLQNFKHLHPRVAAGPHGSYQRQSYHVTRVSTLLIGTYQPICMLVYDLY